MYRVCVCVLCISGCMCGCVFVCVYVAVAASDENCWWGAVIIKIYLVDFLYSGAFWGWPLPITYDLIFIQIHSLHPDLQGLDKLTLHIIQTYFVAFHQTLLFVLWVLF